MFGRFTKKPELKEPEVSEGLKLIEEQKTEVNEKSLTPEKPSKKTEITKKQAKKVEDNGLKSPQAPADMKGKRKPFIGVKEYSSVSEIREGIDEELAETRSALGKYLRQLDDRRAIAERTQRLHDIVVKMANRKTSKVKTNLINLNELEIVLDTSVFDELTAIESVVKSHQQRIVALQKARESLQALDEAGDTEGIKYIAFEKESIPEQILLKLN